MPATETPNLFRRTLADGSSAPAKVDLEDDDRAERRERFEKLAKANADLFSR